MTSAIRFFCDAAWMTPERVKRFGLAGMLAAIAVFAANSLLYLGHGFLLPSGEQLGRDFINYWGASYLALHGHAGQAYDIIRFADFQHHVIAPNADARWYGYPPVAMLLTQPLGFLDFLPAWLLW